MAADPGGPVPDIDRISVSFWAQRAHLPHENSVLRALGFLVSLMSAIIGATGPILNPFYLNYGLEKEAMVGTKTANSFLTGLVQIGTYSAFGVLPRELWLYGLLLGLGAGLGSYIDKGLLGALIA